MDPLTLLNAQFDDATATLERSRALLPGIYATAERMADSLRNDGSILICGNGGSAADAQHFAAELTGRFEIDRRPLRAVPLHGDTSALTAIANDYGFDDVYRRQVAALGRPGDVLVAISTSGNSPNIIKAVDEANQRELVTIGLLGRDGGALLDLCDVSLVVPSERTSRIQEIHGLIIHGWCSLLDLWMATP
ncbi:MAG: D-sedoheptulose 7-phosphate isomerase [bacterium]